MRWLYILKEIFRNRIEENVVEGIQRSFQKEEDVMKKPSNKRTDSSKSSLSGTTIPDSALRERIELKAYELYENRGWVHGLDSEDWLEAERLVLAETKAAAKTDAVTKAKTPGRERTIASKSGSVLDRPRSA
jgi:hypothetical protein